MITIPLADVVSYLRRKGIDPVEVLEGAPIHMPCIGDGLITFEAPDASWGDGVYLYLGRDAICPAAMGWATTVLGRPDDWIEDENGRVLLWHRGDRLWYHLWAWDNRSVPGPDITAIDGLTPPTPAARLRAVLEYEMGRNQ